MGKDLGGTGRRKPTEVQWREQGPEGKLLSFAAITDEPPAEVAAAGSGALVLQADIENGPWPLPGERFDAVVVTNYLWRPLWPQVLASVRPMCSVR